MPTWIWYPGDYEIWLGNKMNNRRTERGAFFPPFWKTDSHYPVVEFSRHLQLADKESAEIAVEGRYNVKLDGHLLFGQPARIDLTAGDHDLCIKVCNLSSPPAVYVSGRTFGSDSSWRVTFEDKEWIDDSGKASSKSATDYRQAGSWAFDTIGSRPSLYRLPRREQEPQSAREVGHDEAGGLSSRYILYDFGRETFGYLRLYGLTGSGAIDIFYGESREEALDADRCETLDKLSVSGSTAVDLATGTTLAPHDGHITLPGSRAFRYVCLRADDSARLDKLTMMEEFSPAPCRGSFRSSSDRLNRIWQVGAETMRLTTREMFIDGIKRDRWTWSGDAVQSYLMNYYLCFDSAAVRRTTWALRGKDPVTSHVNTILDYTFYWFIGISDYYLHTGDAAFVRSIYPRMKTLMDWTISRLDREGMAVGREGDWVFVDWADGPMGKRGALSFEQVLLCRALECMSQASRLAGADTEAAAYARRATILRGKLCRFFWSDSQKALVHSFADGQQDTQVTRYANMFALLYGYLNAEERQDVVDGVLTGERVMRITTPYMRFYELEALCMTGRQSEVLNEIFDYWGGMLDCGATSFWEKYDPKDSGSAHLAMYGRPYGKSLCHAWGASPVYLIGRYWLGVRPTAPGYSEFEVCPTAAGLDWIEGSVPTPFGDIEVKATPTRVACRIATLTDGAAATQARGRLRAFGREAAIGIGDWAVIEQTDTKTE